MIVNNWTGIQAGYLAQSIKLPLNNAPRVGRIVVETRFVVHFMVHSVADVWQNGKNFEGSGCDLQEVLRRYLLQQLRDIIKDV
jgi:hypothetical protein